MDNRKNFLNEIKVNKQEDTELLKLQHKFENKEINLSMMSNEEIHNLNELYTRQLSELKRKIDNKKTELNITNHRISNYLKKFN